MNLMRKFQAKKLPSLAASFLIEIYRLFIAAGLGTGGCCRFTPSCSEYAAQAFKTRPFLEAARLVFFRLLDCRPFGPWLRDEEPLVDSNGEGPRRPPPPLSPKNGANKIKPLKSAPCGKSS